MEALPEAHWQRCYVHFLRNALDYLPRKQADDCLVELRWIYDRHDANEARHDLAAWLARGRIDPRNCVPGSRRASTRRSRFIDCPAPIINTSNQPTYSSA
jgi:transposase-like protein